MGTTRKTAGSNQEARRRRSQLGISMPELLAVFALAGAILAISIPSLLDTVKQTQGLRVAMEARGLVRLANMKTLKEKTEHRVVFHDESASTPNTIELQVDQSGSFVTLDDHVYTAPQGVKILGSGSTDSMDTMTAGARGSCDAGRLYVEATDGTVIMLTIDTRCHTSL